MYSNCRFYAVVLKEAASEMLIFTCYILDLATSFSQIKNHQQVLRFLCKRVRGIIGMKLGRDQVTCGFKEE